MQLSDVRVGPKLLMAFAIVAIIGSINSGIGLYNMSLIDKGSEQMFATELRAVTHLKDADNSFLYVSRATRTALLRPDLEGRNQARAEVAGHLKNVKENIEAAETLFYRAENKAEMAKLKTMWTDLERRANELDAMIIKAGAGDNSEAVAFLFGKTYSTTVGNFRAQLRLVSKLKADRAAELNQENHALYTRAKLFLILFSVLGLVVGLGFGWAIARKIAQGTARAADAARHMADGDMSQKIQVEGRDEIADLLRALSDMQTRLADTCQTIRNGADGVAIASGQIAQGNADLSVRTEQQASTLEETAATMEQLGTTVRQNAEGARHANQLAQAASGVASKGGEVVNQVVGAMKDINESSRKIGDIIGVIDGIAFQTNILALNAAVEAARAGEQGRGFAVVAAEVRSLAQRSAEAAREIKGLITESVARAEHGAQLADRAGATMEEIVASIKRATDIMGEISSASAEQARGVDQVGEAVTQMDKVTQQNAALVEESAAAADSLRQQAQELVQAVGVFKLAAGQHTAPASAAPAPLTASSIRPAPAKAPAAATRPAPAHAATAGTDKDWTEF